MELIAGNSRHYPLEITKRHHLQHEFSSLHEMPLSSAFITAYHITLHRTMERLSIVVALTNLSIFTWRSDFIADLSIYAFSNILKACVLLFPLKRVVFTPRNPRRLLNQSVLKYSNDPTNRVQPNLLSVKMILRLSTLYRRHHQFSYQRSISPVSLRNQRLDLFYRVFRFLSPIAVFLARLTKTVRFILYRKTPHKIKKLRILFPGVRFVASLLQILNYADSIPYFRRLAFWQIPGNTRHQRTYLYSLFAVNYSRRKLVLSSAYIYITLFALHFLKKLFFLISHSLRYHPTICCYVRSKQHCKSILHCNTTIEKPTERLVCLHKIGSTHLPGHVSTWA